MASAGLPLDGPARHYIALAVEREISREEQSDDTGGGQVRPQHGADYL